MLKISLFGIFSIYQPKNINLDEKGTPLALKSFSMIAVSGASAAIVPKNSQGTPNSAKTVQLLEALPPLKRLYFLYGDYIFIFILRDYIFLFTL